VTEPGQADQVASPPWVRLNVPPLQEPGSALRYHTGYVLTVPATFALRAGMAAAPGSG
jgi:hypothetical protein